LINAAKSGASGWDNYEDKFHGFLTANAEKLKDVSDHGSVLAKEQLAKFDQKARQKLEVVIDKIEEKIALLDEQFSEKLGYPPGTITKLAVQMLEEFEHVAVEGLDYLIQIIEEQIDYLTEQVHNIIEEGKGRVYDHTMKMKGRVSAQQLPTATRGQQQQQVPQQAQPRQRRTYTTGRHATQM
jgi:hypothetical protein